jgi:hypothetical protein
MKTTIGIAYRSTNIDPYGNIKFAIISNIDSDHPSLKIVALSYSMHTERCSEGYSKVGYYSAKDAYVVTWAIRPSNGGYNIIATAVSEDGRVSENYTKIYDTPSISDYPESVIPSATSLVAEPIRIILKQGPGTLLQRMIRT